MLGQTSRAAAVAENRANRLAASLVAVAASVLVASSMVPPAVGASLSSGGNDRHWVSTWYGAPHDSTSTSDDQSYRMIVHTALDGTAARVRLSNAYGRQSVTFRSVHIAIPLSGVQAPAVDANSVAPLTFGGRDEVVVPAGGEVRSDPVAFDVPPDGNVAISFHVPGAVDNVTHHSLALTTSYVTVAGSGNHAADPSGAGFTVPTASWSFVTGLEVLSSRSATTVVAIGDSITDGASQVPNSDTRWPDLLNDRLVESGNPVQRSVVNAGISGNMVTADRDGNALQGEAAFRRLERDVLDQPNLSHVIVFEGINDIGESVDADTLIAGYRRIIDALRGRGVKVIGATMTPAFGHVLFGADYTTNDPARVTANEWIRRSGAFDAVVDFSSAVALPVSPEMWNPALSPDLLHPNSVGMQVLADTVDLEEVYSRK